MQIKSKIWLILSVSLVVVLAVLFYVFYNPENIVNDFMNANYGEYDKDLSGWVNKKTVAANDENEESAEPDLLYKICDRRKILLNNEKHMLLAVCGSMTEIIGHSMSGKIDLYILKIKGEDYKVAASLSDIYSGGFGQAGRVTIVRIGKSFYGFKVEDGYAAQGYTTSRTTIYAPDKAGIKRVFFMEATGNGNESCDDGNTECCDLYPELSIKSENESLSIYPLSIQVTGKENGKKANKSYLINFDTKKWQYVMPLDMDNYSCP